MNAVLGFFELLQRTQLSPVQRDYVVKAQAAGQSLLGILNGILDFSKVEAGRLELELVPFQLPQLVHDLAAMFSTKMYQGDIEVLFDVGADLPTLLRGDDLRLKQILLNLLGNAVKFTEQGLVIFSIRALSLTPELAQLQFSVRDTGIGIAADKLSKIFESFVQAESFTTRRFSGTGLGLSISQRLVRLMGGELLVESELGRGSHFHFTLCFARLPAPKEPTADPAGPAASPAVRALLVAARPTTRAVLKTMAESLGWQAETAASAAEGLAQQRAAVSAQRAYTAVFLDASLPDRPGWKAAAELHQLGPDNTRLVLMVTAAEHERLAERLNGPSPLAAVLSKPLTPAMLAAAVLAAPRAGTPVPQPRQPQLTGLRLLVVEDSPINQQVAREILTHEGAIVEVASNGRQGIDRVAHSEQPFDAVLMDVQMPELDGYATSREIRQRLQLTTLPIIAMTANAFAADRQACLAAGMSDHVGKPIDPQILVATILHHCRSAAPPAPPPPALPPAPPSAAAAPSFTLELALERLGDDHSLFATLVSMFKVHHGGVIELVRAQLQQKDCEGAIRELHMLRGAAATLGAAALTRVAADAEAALRGGSAPSAVAALLVPLQARLDEALQVLSPWELPPQPTPSP